MDPKYSNYNPDPNYKPPPLGPRQINKSALKIIIIAFIVPVIIGVGGLLFMFSPSVFSPLADLIDPGPLKGQMLDAVYVPDKDNGKLWILNDGSFSVLVTMETPGHKSTGRECSGCKTIIYIYDPITEEVIKEWETSYNGIPLHAEMFLMDGEVWHVSRETDDNDPLIIKYDSQTGEELMDTQGFVDSHPELKAGINKLVTVEDPKRFNLSLKDGKEYVYLVEEDKLFDDLGGVLEYYGTLGDSKTTVLALVEEDSEARKKLYAITGPKSELSMGRCESHVENADTLEFFCKATAKLLNEDIYLEAMIVQKDDNGVIILHQDQIGRGARRSVTAVDSTGKTLWTIPQENLFPEIAFNENDPFSELFFIQSNINGDRHEDVFVFKFKGVGAIGFNYKSGEKLWEVRI